MIINDAWNWLWRSSVIYIRTSSCSGDLCILYMHVTTNSTHTMNCQKLWKFINNTRGGGHVTIQTSIHDAGDACDATPPRPGDGITNMSHTHADKVIFINVRNIVVLQNWCGVQKCVVYTVSDCESCSMKHRTNYAGWPHTNANALAGNILTNRIVRPEVVPTFISRIQWWCLNTINPMVAFVACGFIHTWTSCCCRSIAVLWPVCRISMTHLNGGRTEKGWRNNLRAGDNPQHAGIRSARSSDIDRSDTFGREQRVPNTHSQTLTFDSICSNLLIDF